VAKKQKGLPESPVVSALKAKGIDLEDVKAIDWDSDTELKVTLRSSKKRKISISPEGS
jgi:uncharacterized DUF497 family protein